MLRYSLSLMLCMAALAGCGRDTAETAPRSDEGGLPKPATAGQSVTGMPDPGVPSARPRPATAQAPDIVEFPDDTNVPAAETEAPAEAPLPIDGVPTAVPEEPMPSDPSAPPLPPDPEAQQQTPENAQP